MEQAKVALDAGLKVIPVVHKSLRGVSPFSAADESQAGDLFSEREARAIMRTKAVYHFVDGGEHAGNRQLSPLCEVPEV